MTFYVCVPYRTAQILLHVGTQGLKFYCLG